MFKGQAKSDLIILFWLCVGAILLRVWSFQFTKINHDETTYLIIAREIFQGKMLYVDVWDTKPPGIFLIFGLFQKVFGFSVVAIRLFASVVIGFTGFVLYRLWKRLEAGNRVAILAGAIYIIAASVHKWEYAANTEIFFNLTTALCLYILLGSKTVSHYLLAGLVMGLGFIIKYFVLFDFVAFCLLILLLHLRERPIKWSSVLVRGTTFFLGFLIPFLLVNCWFWYIVQYEAFYEVTYEVTGRYASAFDAGQGLKFFLEFHLIFLPLVVMAYIGALKNRGKTSKLPAWFGVIWLLLIWFSALWPGKFFLHYYFQFLVPLCFLAPLVFVQFSVAGRWLNKIRLWQFGVVFLLFLGTAWVIQKKAFIDKEDHVRNIVNHVHPRLEPGDVVYSEYSHVVYYYLGVSPVEKYIHSTLLTDPEHFQAIGIDPKKEKERILEASPDWIIVYKKPETFIASYINNYCMLDTTLVDDISIYRRQ